MRQPKWQPIASFVRRVGFSLRLEGAGSYSDGQFSEEEENKAEVEERNTTSESDGSDALRAPNYDEYLLANSVGSVMNAIRNWKILDNVDEHILLRNQLADHMWSKNHHS